MDIWLLRVFFITHCLCTLSSRTFSPIAIAHCPLFPSISYRYLFLSLRLRLDHRGLSRVIHLIISVRVLFIMLPTHCCFSAFIFLVVFCPPSSFFLLFLPHPLHSVLILFSLHSSPFFLYFALLFYLLLLFSVHMR